MPRQLYKQFLFAAFLVTLAVEAARGALAALWRAPLLESSTGLGEALDLAITGSAVSLGMLWVFHRMVGRYFAALLEANLNCQKGKALHSENLRLPSHEMADLFLAHERMLRELEENQHATERKLRAAENNFLRAAKLTTTGELTSTIIHDLRTPLSAIIGYTELLQESLPQESGALAPKTQDRLQKILRAAEHIQSLVSRMSSFVRTGAATALQEGVPLQECILDTEMFLEHHFKIKRVSFRKRYIQTDLRCWGSKQLIVQILVNLCSNAVDAMEDLPQESYRIIDVEVNECGDQLEVSVGDSGPGIPEHIMNEIFKPFFTTKKEGKGTGMGLASCMDIAELLGTKLSVRNKIESQGAVFSFLLHRKDPRASNASEAGGGPESSDMPGVGRVA